MVDNFGDVDHQGYFGVYDGTPSSRGVLTSSEVLCVFFEQDMEVEALSSSYEIICMPIS